MDKNNNDTATLEDRRQLCTSLEDLCTSINIDPTESLALHESLKFPLLVKNLTEFYESVKEELGYRGLACDSSAKINAALTCLSKRLKGYDDLLFEELRVMKESWKTDREKGAISKSSSDRNLRIIGYELERVISLSFALSDDEAVNAFERAYTQIKTKNAEFIGKTLLNLEHTTAKVAKKMAEFVEEFAGNSEYISEFINLEFEFAGTRQPEPVLLATLSKAFEVAKQNDSSKPNNYLKQYIKYSINILRSNKQVDKVISAIERYNPLALTV